MNPNRAESLPSLGGIDEISTRRLAPIATALHYGHIFTHAQTVERRTSTSRLSHCTPPALPRWRICPSILALLLRAKVDAPLDKRELLAHARELDTLASACRLL